MLGKPQGEGVDETLVFHGYFTLEMITLMIINSLAHSLRLNETAVPSACMYFCS